MMERFMLPSDLQSVPIGKLSGGERRRRYLLSILMDAPNVLLPDEPTNDLDIADMEEKIEENQKARAAAGADYVRLQELSEEPENLEAALEAKTERWIYLTELKEKIDAQGK